MKKRIVLGGVVGLASIASALPSDNFNDNLRGPEWKLYDQDPALTIAESGGVLNVLSNNPANATTDAFFDNFVVRSGVTVVPEPASLGMLGAAGMLLMRQRSIKKS